MKYFISTQYSAIQKTVLRHNRLWSIAGISQGLSRLNEIEFPQITADHDGTVMVAGGGKFTAFFARREMAEAAREAMITKLATSFPMLEFQVSPVVVAEHFKAQGATAPAGTKTASAKDQGIIEQLNTDKQRFRGYGVSYLPHLAVCSECGEYPAEEQFNHRGRSFCRTCDEAWKATYRTDSETVDKTTLEDIYSRYFKLIGNPVKRPALLLDFEELFTKEKECGDKETRQRMAVWFSDLNNMNQKVPIWLDQDDEHIHHIFDKVKEVNIAVIGEALAATFPSPGDVMPFRLVVAGGDDLCLVMAEKDILDFACRLDQAIRKQAAQLDAADDNPLSTSWLKTNARPGDGEIKEIGPYSFGASCIIASTHTPFRLIHEQGEALMKKAKEETDRLGNSVNWRIMAEAEAISESLLEFERPLFISKPDNDRPKTSAKLSDYNRLSLEDYLHLREKHANISSSHRFAIIGKLIELGGGVDREEEFETWLKCYAASENDKSFSGLLTESLLREGCSPQGALIPARIATLFELLAIQQRKNADNSTSQEARS